MYTKLHITILKKIRKLLISMIRIKWLVADTISGASTADAGASTADAGTEKKITTIYFQSIVSII